MLVDLWTDGSGTTADCPAGWGVVLVAEDRARGVSGHLGHATNNQAEMTALLSGLRLLRRPSVVCVHTDSEYLMKPFTENWFKGWRDRKWHKVKNDELWRALLDAEKPHILSFQWCRGHSGVELNEICDRMAGAARRNGHGVDTGITSKALLSQKVDGELAVIQVEAIGANSCPHDIRGPFCPICARLKQGAA